MPRPRDSIWRSFKVVGLKYSGNLEYCRCELCHGDVLSESQVEHLRQRRQENNVDDRKELSGMGV